MTTQLIIRQRLPQCRFLWLIGLLSLVTLGAAPSIALSPDSLIAPVFDTLATGCTRLIVGSNGNMGHQGIGNVNLDYWDFGDCDTVDSIPGETQTYLSDASPIIIKKLASPDTVIASWSMFGDGPGSAYGFLPVIDQVPPIAAPLHTSTSTYQKFETGQFITVDSQLAIELNYWAPTTTDSCNFVIQKMLVFPYKGTAQNGLTIGQAFDFDVPSDTSNYNRGGWEASLNLVYQQGWEYQSVIGKECQKNDRRFAGAAMLVYYRQSELAWNMGASHKDMYAGYTAFNDDYISPAGRFVPRELWENMLNPGLAAAPDMTDQHTVLAYRNTFSLPATDTLVVYSALATIRSGTLADLQMAITKAKTWYLGNLRNVVCPACCQGVVGNIDGDSGDICDISDLSALVDYLFFGGSISTCFEETNLDWEMSIDISDLQVLIDFLFLGASLWECPC